MDDQFTTMRTPEIGRWSDQMNAKDFELAPFGRMSLGAMRSTITLADCSAAAVHLVTGRQDMRLNSGSTLPANAHEVFIRNPYSTAIKGKFFEGLPIDIGGKPHENSVHLSMVHRYTVGLDLDAVAGKKLGFALMAKRGHQYIVVEGTKNMNALILPAADAAFVDDIPASMSPEVVDVLRSNGTTNSNYVARHLSYTDADVAAWIAATEWGRSPVLIRSQDNLVRLALEQGTGLFISYPEGAHLTVNLVGTDQGDFSADWRG